MAFDPESIKAAVQKSLNADITIPDGHQGALVVMIDNGKVQLVSAIRINEHWKVESIISHDWQGNNTIGVVSKVTW